MTQYKIGQAAKLLGISTVTLRHYEKIDLVPPSFRSMAGYRMYTDSDIKTLKFVINAKSAGLTLNEIKKLIDIDAKDIHGSQKVKKIIEQKIDILERSVENTSYVLAYLKEIDSLCDGSVSVEECPILLSLRNKQ